MSSPHPTASDPETPGHIASRSCPACYLCGAKGEPLHGNLNDRLYGAPGSWQLKRCSDAGCGLLWLDPMPVEADIGKAYQDYYTHREMPGATVSRIKRAYGAVKRGYLATTYGYGEGVVGRWPRLCGMGIRLHPGRRADTDFSVMYLPPVKNGVLLDVGCGSGRALEWMASLGWQVRGVELDPSAVQIARSQGLDVGLGTLAEQRYPSDAFDAITLSHVIEHVHDPLALLRECRRILKPTGRLVVVTPNSASWGHRRYGASWMHLDPPRHLHIFDAPSLRTLTTAAGFRATSLTTTIRDANGLFLGSRSIARSGRYRMGDVEPNPIRRLWARGMQFAEWMMLWFNPKVGEEVAFVGEKAPEAN